MKIGGSWHHVELIGSALAICVLGMLWRPSSLTARTTSAREAAKHASNVAPAPNRGQSNASGQAQEGGAKKVTAANAYMNIQVLKDIPSDQLLPSMRYITVALGVECNFCHDTKSYDSDDKPEKATARKMMTMMFAINKDNFNGRREVTCYTCHHGVAHAAQAPAAVTMVAAAAGGETRPGEQVPAADHGPGQLHDEHGGGAPVAAGGAASSAAASGTMPTVDEILAKYTEALGGAAAVQKITTLDEKGTMEMPAHGMHGTTVEVWRKAPDKAVADLHTALGDFSQGFNGSAGWQQRPGKGLDDLVGDELVRTRQWASLIPGLDLKKNFSRAQVVAIDKIDDHDAYRVVAFRPAPAGGQVRFYFDKDSGLLLRVSERIESALGALPQDTDYSDYREVNGVKLPFSILVAHADGPTIYKWDQIQANAAVADSQFDKPVAKASQ